MKSFTEVEQCHCDGNFYYLTLLYHLTVCLNSNPGLIKINYLSLLLLYSLHKRGNIWGNMWGATSGVIGEGQHLG